MEMGIKSLHESRLSRASHSNGDDADWFPCLSQGGGGGGGGGEEERDGPCRDSKLRLRVQR
jgi:hypothetical protein